MHPLMLHSSCDVGPVRAVTAAIMPSAQGCTARFRIEGKIEAIAVPPPQPSVRRDGLWQTTCCEIFWQPLGGSAYREFNLSPSGAFAAYDFDSWREGMRDAPLDAIAIFCAQHAGALELEASIAAMLGTPAQVGMSAVIELADGRKQYWALAFPPGAPDFHAEAGRTLIIAR